MSTVMRRLETTPKRRSGPTVRAHVRLHDENGPKGGLAVRCRIEARVPRRGPIHVTARATSARAALVDALDKLERRLRHLREAARDRRRRSRPSVATAATSGGGWV
jgi:ribosome-associated translation inhibitor RaiA